MTDLQIWVSVLEMGCFYGLIALGYLLVLQGAGFFNFALGPYATVAGMTTAWLVAEHEVPLWPAALLGLAAVVALSVLTELVVVRRVQSRSSGSELPALVAIAAVLFMIEQSAGLAFGHQPLAGQSLLRTAPLEFGDVVVQPYAVLLIGVTALVFAATALWIRYGRSGRLLRAVGDGEATARLLGLPVARVRLLAFAVSGVVAGVAGLLFAPKAGLQFDSGLGWTLNGFLALVVGGTRTVWGPLAGGLLLGAVQMFVPYYLGSEFVSYVVLGVALVFFAFRPEGIFVWRVRT